jgi:hypothetical protein
MVQTTYITPSELRTCLEIPYSITQRKTHHLIELFSDPRHSQAELPSCPKTMRDLKYGEDKEVTKYNWQG